jgi:hypothetical protein
MNWHLIISDKTNGAMIFESDGTAFRELGFVEFTYLGDFLKFLSILPQNRVKIDNPETLINKGVPFELTKEGKISKTSTIRKLNNYTSREISALTGMNEKVVSEIYSRMKRKEGI